MTPSAKALRLDVRDDGVAVLTFDLPNSRANTLGQPVLAEFEQVVAELAKRTELRGLVLRSGKPGMFIAGADLRELGGLRDDPAGNRFAVKRGLDVIGAFEALPY